MFILRFETDNDQFVDTYSRNHEIKMILNDVASEVATGKLNGNIRDINGNTIGRFEYSK